MSNLEDDPYVAAAILGKEVVLPEINELLIDIDDADGRATLLKNLTTASGAGILIDIVKTVPSQTEGHFHVYCTVRLPKGSPYDEITPELRVALQAALGSDRKREMLSIARMLVNTSRAPTLFFEDSQDVREKGGESPEETA